MPSVILEVPLRLVGLVRLRGKVTSPRSPRQPKAEKAQISSSVASVTVLAKAKTIKIKETAFPRYVEGMLTK